MSTKWALLYGPTGAAPEWVGRVAVSDALPYPPLITVIPTDPEKPPRVFWPEEGSEDVDKYYEGAVGGPIEVPESAIDSPPHPHPPKKSP